MITIVLNTVNNAVQITGRAIAFVLGILLLAFCWPLRIIVNLIIDILSWIVFIPSWVSGRLILFSLNIAPAQAVKGYENQAKLDAAKKMIQEILQDVEKNEKQSEDTHDSR